MRRLLVTALALLMLAPSIPRAADGSSEAALRRRVHRFYVLSFLNRHGEMWEMFTPSLQERLGGDRRAYVRDARSTGFELYQSQVETLSIEQDKAVVDVSLQVQLPGALSLSWRRHRMVWRLVEGAWLYAGSMDVTHEETARPPAPAELEPLPGMGVGAPEPAPASVPSAPEPARMLPSPAPAPAPAPSPASKPAPSSPDGERWDLVAIPPEGQPAPPAPIAQAAPPPVALAPPAAVEPAPAPAPVAVPEPAPAPPPAPVATIAREDQLVPPERATRAPAPAPRPGDANAKPGKPVAPAPSGDEDADDPLTVTVRKAAEGNPMRRQRALTRLAPIRDPAVIPLLAASIDAAPPESQAAFLTKLADLGATQHLPLALSRLGAESVTVRAAAAAATGELGTAADQAAVGALVADSYQDVRVAALRALGILGGQPGALLRPVLEDVKAEDIERVAAARSAGLADAEDCEEALLALVRRRSPAAAAAESIEALGRLSTPSSIEALTALLSDRSVLAGPGFASPVRLLAARALALSEAEGAGRILAKALNEFPDSSSAADADLVAATGESDAVLLLLANGRANVRRRAADLAGRSVETATDRMLALEAVEAARNAETDADALLAEQTALERLRVAQPSP